MEMYVDNNKREVNMLYLTPDQLCERYQIKKRKLYQMTSQKKIPFLKFGNELRFDQEEVTKFFEVKPKRILV